MNPETVQHLESAEPAPRLGVWLVFLVPLLIVFAVLGQHAALDALWTDELFSLGLAEDPPAAMLARLWEYQRGYYDHPPLYFMLLHYVLAVGNSPFVLRFPSMVCVALAIGVMGRLAMRQGFKTPEAIAFTAALSLHPLLLETAGFVRMYAPLLLMSSVLLGSLLRIMDGIARSWQPCAIAAVILALMVYTSYFSILLGVGVGVLGLLLLAAEWKRERHFRPGSLRLLAACAGAAVLVAPWLPVIAKLLGNEGAERGLSPDRLLEVAWVFRDLSGGWIGLPFVLAGWAAVFVDAKLRWRWSALLLATFVVPLVLLAVKAPPDRPVIARYVMYCFPAVFLGAAIGWRALLERLGPRLPAAAVAVVLAAYWAFMSWTTVLVRPPDWWAVAEVLERQAQPREVILTGGFLSGEAVVYHMKHPERHSFAHYVLSMDDFYVTCRDAGTVWYVNSAPVPDGYHLILLRYFPYRTEIEGNAGLGPIQLYAKRPFTLEDGSPAPYHEPVPLPYEK